MTLLNLDRMRSSEVYRKYTSVQEMVKLEEKYTIGGTVGDQVCGVFRCFKNKTMNNSRTG